MYLWIICKKKTKQEILEVWGEIKEKIIVLLGELDSLKANKESIIERYERKIKEKNNEMAKLEEEYKDLSDIILKVRNKQFLIVLLYKVLKEVGTGSGDISRLEF